MYIPHAPALIIFLFRLIFAHSVFFLGNHTLDISFTLSNLTYTLPWLFAWVPKYIFRLQSSSRRPKLNSITASQDAALSLTASLLLGIAFTFRVDSAFESAAGLIAAAEMSTSSEEELASVLNAILVSATSSGDLNCPLFVLVQPPARRACRRGLPLRHRRNGREGCDSGGGVVRLEPHIRFRHASCLPGFLY